MIKWAIRHKPTGHFMPQSSSKRHGYTHDEPTDCGNDSHWCMRLFGREQDAKTALTWWLKGETTMHYTGGMHTNAWGEADDDFGEDWHTKIVVARKAEDMEVVRMNLEIINPAPKAPRRWEVGMVVQYLEDSEWAWNAGSKGVVWKLGDLCADREPSEYQVFWTHPIRENGEVYKGASFWTTPSDVRYTGEKL